MYGLLQTRGMWLGHYRALFWIYGHTTCCRCVKVEVLLEKWVQLFEQAGHNTSNRVTMYVFLQTTGMWHGHYRALFWIYGFTTSQEGVKVRSFLRFLLLCFLSSLINIL